MTRPSSEPSLDEVGASPGSTAGSATATPSVDLADVFAALRQRLQESGYLTVHRLHCPDLAPRSLAQPIRQTLTLAPPRLQDLLRLLYLEESIPRARAESALGPELAAALCQAGILIENGAGEVGCRYQLEVAEETLLLTEDYRARPQRVYYGEDSQFLRSVLRPRPGDACLDLCSGTGVQGLRCAPTAATVDMVDINPAAVRLARLNAALNGVSDRVRVFEGDLWSALPAASRYDYVVSNPPLMPVADEVDYPIFGHGGPDGLRIVRRILAGLEVHLRPGGRGILIGVCTGDERRPDVLAATEELLGRRFRASLFLLLQMPLRDWIRLVAHTSTLFYPVSFQNAVLRSRAAYSSDAGKDLVYSYLLECEHLSAGEGGCEVIDYSKVAHRGFWFLSPDGVAS